MPMLGEILVYNHEGTHLEGPREHNKSSLISEFSHEVSRPYDAELNRLTGVRKIKPFMIVKEIDKLTPQLYEISCKGRNCKKIVIKLYRTAKDTGDEEEYFNYILEDAQIVSLENHMPSTKDPATEMMGHQEAMKVLAKRFTWKYLEGGIEYTEENV